MLDQIASPHVFQSEELVSMEVLDMNAGSGQSYGYIVYETTLEFTELTASLVVILLLLIKELLILLVT